MKGTFKILNLLTLFLPYLLYSIKMTFVLNQTPNLIEISVNSKFCTDEVKSKVQIV